MLSETLKRSSTLFQSERPMHKLGKERGFGCDFFADLPDFHDLIASFGSGEGYIVRYGRTS
jgi:hypothetical protein